MNRETIIASLVAAAALAGAPLTNLSGAAPASRANATIAFQAEMQRQAPCERAEPAYCEEVRRIASAPAVRRAFEYIREIDERTIREHVVLNEIPAPPFMEARRARRHAVRAGHRR